ncbi:MAG: hypothetical protein KDC34_08395 [Saprospiraceae bacterium]|nr:hypothetical protein [Saprospiraceae bacterium]
MNRSLLIFYLIGCTSLLQIGCKQQAADQTLPLPTEINPNQEEGEVQSDAREKWEQLMHRAAPGTDWAAMDRQTLMDLYKDRKEQKEGPNKILEVFGNGNLSGDWDEKGSLNQAGNLVIIDYDQDTDNIYGISAGGIVWRGHLSGTGWTPLNDDLIFSNRVLKVIPNASGGKRILAAIGKNIWYSDNDGATWSQSNLDIDFYSDWGSARNLVALNDANHTLYYLAHTWDAGPWSSRMWLYYSTDRGSTFTRINVFEPVSGTGGIESSHTSLWSPLNSTEAYILHQGQDLYELNGSSVTLLNSNNDLPINTWLDLEGYSDGSTRIFYALMAQKDLYQSTDDGQTWTYQGQTNVNTWNVGISASPFDPNTLYYGAVECYRSNTAGSSWNRVTVWWKYYSNTDSLHADIMDIKSFEKNDGTKFVLIANHGGLHVSSDNLAHTVNIGKSGLNISQYYDVRTDPLNNAYIYGGTQDQGLQRTSTGNNPGPVNFTQVVSGDYGHFAFTQNGQSLWKVYPFGSISYYNNAQTNSGSSSYNLGGSHPPVEDWIYPTSETADPASNTIYVAGGNISGGTGSYLVKLTAATSSPYTISASQFAYNFRSNSASGTSAISAIEPCWLDSDRIFVSTDDGTFFYTNDGGSSWNISSISNGPGEYWLYGSCILSSQLNPDKVIFAGSGYSSPPVFISNDGGQTFTSMSTGMPGTMVHEVVANTDETLYFAATEVGPYVYVVSEGQWYPMSGVATPLQRYFSVEYIDAIQTVRFGSYGRGIWDFIISSQPVPVELVSFEARLTPEQSVILNWETANEVNSEAYVIERSMDGTSFDPLFSVDAIGQSSSEQNYEAIDRQPNTGINYYRLKAIDLDGSYSYSPVRSVELRPDEIGAVLFPNPARPGTTLFVRGSEEITQLQIWTSSGQRMGTFPVREGMVNPDLRMGIYIYQFLNSNSRPIGSPGRLVIQ